jgi:peptidoglycan hydrolase-like protein with peptidoglycan-binding domain
MTQRRTIRIGSEGEDVREAKLRLFALGCYAEHVTAVTTDVYGADTQDAVRTFQFRSGLTADGIIGPLTWAALFPEEHPIPTALKRGQIPQQIGDAAAGAILAALDAQSEARRGIVLDALQYAYDADMASRYPISLYIRGGNLYNTDLTPNVITLKRIETGARRQPEYYDGGRREMMERAVQNNPAITGADCSGGVVGLLRHAGVVSPKYDLSADGFAANTRYKHIKSEALLPADLLHKNGHVGLYAGGGYAVEWMGGAYGCQLTRLAARHGWNFVTQRMDRFGSWTEFLRPNEY